MVGIGELWLGRVRNQFVNQFLALFSRPVDDVRGVCGEIQRLAPRPWMGPHQHLMYRRQFSARRFVIAGEPQALT